MRMVNCYYFLVKLLLNDIDHVWEIEIYNLNEIQLQYSNTVRPTMNIQCI